jgi:hypothetical protein
MTKWTLPEGRKPLTDADIAALTRRLADTAIEQSELYQAAKRDAEEAEAYAAELEKERDALKVTYDDIYADAMSDAESDARDFESDLWKGIRRLITKLGFDWSGDVQYDGVPADEAVEFLRDAINEIYSERERLALAICGGEDAPGYANAQTVEALEKVARDNANATMEHINRTLEAEAKLAKVSVFLRFLDENYRHAFGDTARQKIRELYAELEGKKQ